jgi:hypothetical protein
VAVREEAREERSLAAAGRRHGVLLLLVLVQRSVMRAVVARVAAMR